MQRMLSSIMVIGSLLSVQAGAESMVTGQVRLAASGEPVAGAQVRLFDLSDLRSWMGTTTDETGSFALPLGALPGAAVQPTQFHLGSNYPNPFNPATVIPYRLQRSMSVRLEVFNVLGQHIATLVDGQQSEGFHTAYWDGTNEAGQAVAAGVYLYRLSGEGVGVQATRSMVLIDGQAGTPGVSAGRVPQMGAEATEATSVYGLTVSGPGLMPFVDPAFQVGSGSATVELVEASAGLSRTKMAFSGPCSSGGVLGDMDNNDRVDVFDALLAALYSMDSSIILPNNGDISLGDVNTDGRIDLTDAYLIAGWLNDPSDPTLPAGIGEAACSDDRAALVALYEATDGANWTNNTNWLSDAQLNEWYGVTTDDGRVVSLDLRENWLSGALPSSLGDLTHLQELDLSDNYFSGSLPFSLVNLTHLQRLYLENTQLCAPLDAAFQAWLEGIENKVGVVDCPEVNDDRPTEEGDRAKLAEMRREIDALIGDAESASIEDCRYMGLGDKPCGGPWEYVIYSVSSTDSTALAERVTAYNAFEGEMNRRYMYISDCMYEMPPVLVYRDGRCLVLTEEDYRAQLAEVRREFVKGVEIEPLVFPGAGVSKQPLTYSLWGIPPGLSFDAATRTLSGTPTVSGTYEVTLEVEEDSAILEDSAVILTSFTVIVYDNSDLSSERAVLVALYEATDGENWENDTHWLSDRLLDEWYGVTTDNGRVTHLDLGGNELSGALPAELGNLTNLQRLDLVVNQLSGVLPAELGNLTNLKVLSLQINQLSGTIPSELGKLSNLETLYLHDNQLSGSIPSELGNLTNLKVLGLNSNQLSGELPASLGNLTSLEDLYLYENALSGALPAELGNLTNLESLLLRDNDFSGALPAELGNLTNLDVLYLGNTQLCAPTDASFQRWLEGIDYKKGVVNCAEDNRESNFRFVEGAEIAPVVFPEVIGGEPPLTYSMSGIPPGLSFDGDTRTLSGTPTVAGTYEVTYTVVDSVGASAETTFIVIVEPSGG